MAGTELRLDFRDLAVAARDSCGLRPALFCHLIKRAAVSLESGLLATQLLPPLHDDIYVLRVQLEAVAKALRQFRGRECSPAAKKGS
jgi:hypothetical protein